MSTHLSLLHTRQGQIKSHTYLVLLRTEVLATISFCESTVCVCLAMFSLCRSICLSTVSVYLSMHYLSIYSICLVSIVSNFYLVSFSQVPFCISVYQPVYSICLSTCTI